MSWYEKAVFYHIYPLGLTGAPKYNEHKPPADRLKRLQPWMEHIQRMGFNALYIGPLFESVGHGYETTDYCRVDGRLGTNEDLKDFVKDCHRKGIRVILDGVFNHTGRDFFAFKDLQENREASWYKDWYCNVNFWQNNEYNDGFSYENWGGYNLLVKLNQKNPEVVRYIQDVIRFWIREFDIDGIRLDAADVMDFEYMKAMRQAADECKEDFWLMGEVVHGDYSRYVNPSMLDSVTNYELHKGLYSGHNDHNYFEIAHTVQRLLNMQGVQYHLYNFADNHDVSRLASKLNNKQHLIACYTLLYTLPGIPSVYYGSEFGLEGQKERGSDDPLRPCLNLADFQDAIHANPLTRAIAALGKAKAQWEPLSKGQYEQLFLTTRQYAFARTFNDQQTFTACNSDDSGYVMSLPVKTGDREYVNVLSGERLWAQNGSLVINVPANSAVLLVPYSDKEPADQAGEIPESRHFQQIPAQTGSSLPESREESVPHEQPALDLVIDLPKPSAKPAGGKAEDLTPEDEPEEQAPEKSEKDGSAWQQQALEQAFDKGVIQGLQMAVLARMEKNGPVSEQMKGDVERNIWPDSLINWIKSF